MDKSPLQVKVESLLESLARELDVIERYGEIRELTWSAIRERSDSQIAKRCLEKLRSQGTELSMFFDALLFSGDGPLVVVSSHLYRFYYERYVPNLETLNRLRSESHWPEDRLGPLRRSDGPAPELVRRDPEEFSFLPLDIEDVGSVCPGVTLGDFVRQVYRAAELAIDWDDVEGDPDAFPYGLEVLESRWFRPERWVENSVRIRPIIISRDTSTIPKWVQGHLTEVHACLIQDLHLAAIALCRSALEAVIRDRARRFGVEPNEDGPTGESTRKLRDVADDLVAKLPELESSFDIVVTYGNQALHAPTRQQRHQNAVTPASAEHYSFYCFRHLRRIVEALYAENGPEPVRAD